MMHRAHRPFLTAAGIALAMASACSSSKRTIRIPDSILQNPRSPGGARASRRSVEPYVIKMSDGHRTWQIEIPASEAAGAFQAVVPLNLGETALAAPGAPQTEADREIQADSPKPAKTDGAQPTTTARSYLGTLARVKALFKRRQYELALVELVALDREYPDDPKILEMKGTLYWKMRRPKLAREAWERVLTLEPDNTPVARALEDLQE